MTVDWGKLATGQNSEGAVVTYPIAVENVPRVGKKLAELILSLVLKCGVSLSSIHIIGYSLGSHVAGEAGNFVQMMMGGEKVARITGETFLWNFILETLKALLQMNKISTKNKQS